jgi:hypothetical protein
MSVKPVTKLRRQRSERPKPPSMPDRRERLRIEGGVAGDIREPFAAQPRRLLTLGPPGVAVHKLAVRDRGYTRGQLLLEEFGDGIEPAGHRRDGLSATAGGPVAISSIALTTAGSRRARSRCRAGNGGARRGRDRNRRAGSKTPFSRRQGLRWLCVRAAGRGLGALDPGENLVAASLAYAMDWGYSSWWSREVPMVCLAWQTGVKRAGVESDRLTYAGKPIQMNPIDVPDRRLTGPHKHSNLSASCILAYSSLACIKFRRFDKS